MSTKTWMISLHEGHVELLIVALERLILEYEPLGMPTKAAQEMCNQFKSMRDNER